MDNETTDICILMDYYRDPWAGTESQVFKLVQGLLERGVGVRFVVLRGSEYTQNGRFPVPVEVLNVGKIASLGSFLKMYRLGRSLRKQGTGLVHVFFNDASVLAPPIMKVLGIPCLISRRDMGFWYTAAYRRILPITGRFVTAAICNSQAVAKVTEEVECLSESKLSVIYNGYPELKAQSPEPRILTVNEKALKVGIVANLRPIKRIGDAIESVALARSKGIEIELHVIGGGDDEPYRRQATRLGIEAACNFWGQQTQVDDFIAGFDIALLTSESEGFSNSIIEYMRNAKPVICTDTGGNSEIVEHGINGYLYPVGDVESLASRLVELAHEPERRAQMGQAGQGKVLSAYSVERMLDEHLALYGRITGKRITENLSHA
ncbi:glycosyltransferase family 4 protein [Marinobacter halotolerans]|uniref:glycosyltransferase family 4 protein n=1 Tax=Marinobacter halotolerans TaxID=1569211 RepID=UPI001248CE01|nr:glycosyltransferase family 4 protein [Marinobacter halotolerans]